jgi:hypothetical protein
MNNVTLEERAKDLRRQYHREYQRNWRNKHREHLRIYQRKWRAAHPEKAKEYRDNYWLKKAREQESQGG